jgi:hypothetical protein
VQDTFGVAQGTYATEDIFEVAIRVHAVIGFLLWPATADLVLEM